MTNSILRILNNFFSSQSRCYMDKEISEESHITEKLIRKYIKLNFNIDIEIPQDIKHIVLIASGSSYHCAAIVSDFINSKIHSFSDVYYSSEVCLNKDYKISDNTLYIFISQSGETKDTNEAFNLIASKTKNTFAITNTKNSTLYDNCRYKILTDAGSERAIASTKAMCAQTFCLFLTILKIMQNLGIDTKIYVEYLLKVPSSIDNALAKSKELKQFSKIFAQNGSIILLANGSFYRLAKEGALKIRETSYLNSFACPMGEFLHGHMAILNNKSSVIFIVNKDNIELTKNVINRLEENYKFDKLIISDSQTNDFNKKDTIVLNSENYFSYLFSCLTILQLCALQISEILNRNTDKPSGLSKVVK